MPTLDLSTVVVEEGGVPAERLDDALQRQVLSGGALDTVLLEMGLVDEAAILRLLSRSEGLPAVGKTAIDKAEKAAVAMFPRRLAEKHGIIPLSVSGRTLSVAVARAPDVTLLDEIGFMLSVYVRPYVTAEARIAYALHRYYDVPLPARFEGLLSLLGEDVDEMRRPPSDIAIPIIRDDGGNGWSVVSARLAAVEAMSGPPTATSPAVAAGGLMGGATPAAPSPAEEAKRRLLARLDEEERQERAREESRRRERVRWTVDDAIAELALTEDRDAMLDVTLRFAYRRLATAAIFVVQRHAKRESKPAFVLWDVIHARLGKSETSGLAISTEGSHALAQLFDIRSHFLGPLPDDDPLARAFGERPRAAVLVPIVVGDGLAGVLYGDNGDKAIPPSSLAELHMVVPRLGKALRNLILRRKRAAIEEQAEAAATVAVAPRAEPIRVPAIAVDLADVESDAVLDAAFAGMEAASAGSFVAEPELIDDVDVVGRLSSEGDAAPPEGPEATAEPRPDPLPPSLARPQPSPPPAPGPTRKHAAPPPLPQRAGRAPAVEPPARHVASPAVKSPGASARESLLLATWRDWLKHEDNETDELLGALQQPGEAGRHAISSVVARGDDAMPSLARYFPGVLAVHPFGHIDARPYAAELSDACACLVRLGADRAAPILIGEVEHDDRLHRYTAVLCLTELRVPAALPRLAQRVFDSELRIALLALSALDTYRNVAAFPKVLEWLREFCRRGDVEQRKRAILAASELGDRDALEALVALLGTRPKDVAEDARRALVDITLQDFGFSERRWRAWIADSQRRPRVAWLIDGLSHKEAAIRERAQQELNRLTGENFGFRADASRKERELAVKAWSDWWTAQPADRWP